MKVRFFRMLATLATLASLSLLAACSSPSGGGDSGGNTGGNTQTGNGTKANPTVLTVAKDYSESFALAAQKYYRFTVTDPGLYKIATTNAAATPSLVLELDSNSDYTGTIASAMLTANGLSDLELTAGTYYLTLTNSKIDLNTSTFILNVSKTGNLPFEGTIASPIPLVLDTDHAGTVSMTNGSYYSVTLAQDGIYSLPISSLSSGDVTMNLYSDAIYSTSIKQSYRTATGLTDLTLRAGTYFLKITTVPAGSRTFIIKPTRTGDFPSEGTQAAPVQLTTGVSHAAKVAPNFDSYYSVTVTDGLYTVPVSALSGGYLNLYLYSDSGFLNQITSYTYSTTGLGTIGLTAGTYYLKITTSSSNLTFNLNVNRTKDYTAEGTLGNPIELIQDVAHSGKVGINTGATNSYYKFTVSDSALYNIAAASLSSTTTFAIYSDPLFTAKVRGSKSTTGVSGTELTPGTWYLMVTNTTYVDLTYTLTLSRTGAYVRDGSLANPLALTLGTAFAGKVGYTNTQETPPYDQNSYYKFTVDPSGGVYNFKIENLSRDTISLFFYNAANFTTVQQTISSTTTGASVGFSTGGTWYLKIVGNQTTYNKTYTMTVTKTASYVEEGTKTNPIQLILESPRAARVGTAVNLNVSYYTFTVTQEGSYNIGATGLSTNLNFVLYATPGFGYNASVYGSNSKTGITARALKAGTYFIAVYNNSAADVTYTIMASRAGDYPTEGTAASPIALTPGVAHAAKVGWQDCGDNTSYYTFTITELGLYSIAATGNLSTLSFSTSIACRRTTTIALAISPEPE